MRKALVTLSLSALFLGNVGIGHRAHAAGDCNVDAIGAAAYGLIKQKVRERLPKIQQFDFDEYKNVEISTEAECVLVMHGRFTFKKQRNQESRVYDARVTPEAGAPRGIKILQLQLSRN